MAIKTVEEKKKQQKLLIMAGIIFLAMFLVLYFGVIKKNTSTIDNTGATQSGEEVVNKNQQAGIILEQKLKRIDFNFDFINDKILPFLQMHGNLPVEKGETGRANPFISPQK